MYPQLISSPPLFPPCCLRFHLKANADVDGSHDGQAQKPITDWKQQRHNAQKQTKYARQVDYHYEISQQLKRLRPQDPCHTCFTAHWRGEENPYYGFAARFWSKRPKDQDGHRTFKTPTNATVEISMMGSNYHTELNPADVGNKTVRCAGSH